MINKLYEKIKNFIKNNYKFLIVMLVIILLFYVELPFMIYKSGGTIDLKKRLEIETSYREDGKLQMSYVSALKGTPAFILLSFILPDWDLYPLEEITNEGNYDDVITLGKVYLKDGINNAKIAAFQEAGEEVKITKTINTVAFLSDEAETNIKIGDEIISVNGTKTSNLDELRAYINTLKENEKVKVKVKHDDKEYERYAIVYKEKDDSLKIGVAFSETYEYKTEIPVSVKMKDNESGSSGGLMMSLAIYNALTKEDITHGLNIVGTGAITSDGVVEEIDGVKYKVLGAEKNHADIFLCPEENYDEAVNIKKKRNLKIEIVKVKTLKEAIEYLNSK